MIIASTNSKQPHTLHVMIIFHEIARSVDVEVSQIGHCIEAIPFKASQLQIFGIGGGSVVVLNVARVSEKVGL